MRSDWPPQSRSLEGIGMDAVAAHDASLAQYALQRLSDVAGLTIYGPQERGALVSFAVDGIHPHDLASLLDEDGIAVRAGHHCAQPLHGLLGVPATTRASFYVYNEPREVDLLIDGIERAKQAFGA